MTMSPSYKRVVA